MLCRRAPNPPVHRPWPMCFRVHRTSPGQRTGARRPSRAVSLLTSDRRWLRAPRTCFGVRAAATTHPMSPCRWCNVIIPGSRPSTIDEGLDGIADRSCRRQPCDEATHGDSFSRSASLRQGPPLAATATCSISSFSGPGRARRRTLGGSTRGTASRRPAGAFTWTIAGAGSDAGPSSLEGGKAAARLQVSRRREGRARARPLHAEHATSTRTSWRSGRPRRSSTCSTGSSRTSMTCCASTPPTSAAWSADTRCARFAEAAIRAALRAR